MIPQQRLLNALRGEAVDRPPVVIPGGMMAGSLFALLQQTGISYPDVHTLATAMTEYAVLLQKTCELDNYGVPFCMTIEAEDFGAEVDLGDPLKEPRVTQYPAVTLNEVLALDPSPCIRHRITLEAITLLTGREVPVIGNVIGPTSLLTSLIEPNSVYRAMAKNGDKVARALKHVSHHIINFAEAQIAAGAKVIVIADPGSSGEIIGGEYFNNLVVPVLDMIIRAMKKHEIPVVLHICGNIMTLVKTLATLPWDALSVDSVVSLKKLKAHFPERPLMGNISTHLLAVSKNGKVYKAARKAVEVSSILSPACGLSTTTLPENIRCMVAAARDAADKLDMGKAIDG